MSAVRASQLRQRRYRRRILGWGSAGLLVIFAIGAVIFVNRTEDDLERRTNDKLVAAEVFLVTSQFSGQDGTLSCDEGPVAIPDDVLDDIRDMWGVNDLQVDASCRAEDVEAAEAAGAADRAEPVGTDPPVTDGATVPVTTDEDASTTVVDDSDTILDVIANDSQFSELQGLVGDAALEATLTGEGPFTLFAPTNEAVQALGPDEIAALGRDTELLATVLSHHVTPGALTAADLTPGEIEMLDGTTVSSDITDGVVLTSAGSVATVSEADLVASNGIVHAIDQVLLPEGAAVGPDPSEPVATATLEGGQIILLGSVASESQREELVAAAATGLDRANVVDELVVSAASGVTDEQAADFAALVAVMPTNLVSGETTLTSDELSLRGVYADDEALAVLQGAADAVEVTPDLTQRADATDEDAATLESDLNEFVAANPVLFEPSSAEISEESGAVLDQVAALANRIGGVGIQIQGHTDTDGSADANVQLSLGRASAVLDALVARGVDPASLTATGFGGTDPIRDASGVEDKVASRRVEFVVEAQ